MPADPPTTTARPAYRKVALYLNLLTHATRTMATGFAKYASERGNWSLSVVHGHGQQQTVFGEANFEELDGVAAGYEWESYPRSKCPVVFLHTPDHPNQHPTVCSNNAAIGQLAASHLLSLGLPYYSFVGISTNAFSYERQRAFEKALTAQSHTLQPPLLFEKWRMMTNGGPVLDAWLKTLLLPCAVFCADDRMASSLATAAHRAGIQVPEQLAILGVNNDDLACAATVPPLSSISINGEQIGYEAARQLDRAMAGDDTYHAKLTRIAPGDVVQRGSTRVLGYEDPIVSDAMRLILSRAPREQVMAEDIAEVLQVNRQQLHRSFVRCVGRSPKEEIDRVRADRLRALLLGSTRPVKQIAYDMGFVTSSQLIRFCHRAWNKTPLEVREERHHPIES